MENLMTVFEVAAVMRLRVGTIRKWIYLRKLPHLKLGSRVLIRKQDLDALIAESLVPVKKGSESVKDSADRRRRA